MGNLTSTQFMNPGSCSPIFLAKTVDEEMHREITSLPWVQRPPPKVFGGFWKVEQNYDVSIICLSSNWGDFCRDAVAHAPRLLEWNSLQPCEYIWQSLTCILRRYLIMAGCLGSCTATILLVDWTISNYGFKLLFLGAKDQPVCYTQVSITQPFADVFPIERSEDFFC